MWHYIAGSFLGHREKYTPKFNTRIDFCKMNYHNIKD